MYTEEDALLLLWVLEAIRTTLITFVATVRNMLMSVVSYIRLGIHHIVRRNGPRLG